MNRNIPFRAWFYFRSGWGTYFAFIFAAINTLVVTYFLAIENAPFLKEIFPTFTIYVIILVSIGIPLLILIGYVHYKRSPAYKTESEISFETNPPLLRTLLNTEAILSLYLQISNLLVKLSKNEKLTDEEMKELSELQNKIKVHMGKRLPGRFNIDI